MANCVALKNILKDDCLNNIGSLVGEILVFDSADRGTITVDANDETYTAMSYATGSPSVPVLPAIVTFHKDSATFEETSEVDGVLVNAVNTVTLTVTLNSRAYTKSAALSIMGSSGRELDVVFRQKSGTNWVILGATLKVDSKVGATKKEGSTYTLTFTAEVDRLVYGIDSADYETLKTTGSFS